MRLALPALALFLIGTAVHAQDLLEREREFLVRNLSAVRETPTGDRYYLGRFEDELTLGEHTITPTWVGGGRFVAKQAASGEWKWLRLLETTGTMNDDYYDPPVMDLAQDGHVVIAGTYDYTMFYEGVEVGNGDAYGGELYVLHLSPIDGTLMRMDHWASDMLHVDVACLPNGGVALTGEFEFNGTIDLEIPQLDTNIAHEGTVLLVMDAQGQPTLATLAEREVYMPPIAISDVCANGDLLLLMQYEWGPIQFLGQTFGWLNNTSPEYTLLRVRTDGTLVWAIEQEPGTFGDLTVSEAMETADGTTEVFLTLSAESVDWGGVTFAGPGSYRVRLDAAGTVVGQQPVVMGGVSGVRFLPRPQGEAFVVGRYAGSEAFVGGFPVPQGIDINDDAPFVAYLGGNGEWHSAYYMVENYTPNQSAIISDLIACGDGSVRIVGWYRQSSTTLDGIWFPTPEGTEGGFMVTYDDLCMRTIKDSVDAATCAAPEGGALYMHGSGGVAPYTWAWTDGADTPVRTGLTAGMYQAVVTDAEGCTVQVTVDVPGVADPGAAPDLVGLVTTTPFFRPGLHTQMHAQVLSPSCEPSAVVMSIALDPDVSYVSGMEPGDVLDGDTIRLDFGVVDVEHPATPRHLVLSTEASVTFNSSVCFQISVEAAGNDPASYNDDYEVCYPVLNSFDPNDKTVVPPGVGPEGFVEEGVRSLDYLVRFQNTGNAPAFNVFIDDTLDADLDLAGLQVLEHSHPMEVDILGDRTLRFRFDDIHLPDSTSNEPGSHGYVAYRIPLKAETGPGTVVRNTAHIFFDLNPAVVTNTTVTTLTGETSVLDITSPHNGLFLAPNPTEQRVVLTVPTSLHSHVARLFDQQGRELFAFPVRQERTEFDVQGLTNGVYVLRVGDACTRLVKVGRP